MAFMLKLNKGRGIAAGATLKFVRFASSDGAAGAVEEDTDGSQVEEAQEMIKFEIPPEGYIGLNADAGHSLNEKLSYMGGIFRDNNCVWKFGFNRKYYNSLESKNGNEARERFKSRLSLGRNFLLIFFELNEGLMRRKEIEMEDFEVLAKEINIEMVYFQSRITNMFKIRENLA